MVALDVKNAFNSPNWDWIKKKLTGLGGPGYLARSIKSYLSFNKTVNTQTGGYEVVSKPFIKYLGMTNDMNLSLNRLCAGKGNKD